MLSLIGITCSALLHLVCSFRGIYGVLDGIYKVSQDFEFRHHKMTKKDFR
jgi:hypothetical protein